MRRDARLPGEIRPLIHGDALSYMIGAASIIAKVTRDRYRSSWTRNIPSMALPATRAMARQSTLRL